MALASWGGSSAVPAYYRSPSALLHKASVIIWAFIFAYFFPAKQHFYRVEPRGFEPLTSAVRRRHDSFPEVSRACKIPANKHIISEAVFSIFQDIYYGLLHTERARQDSNLR